MQKAIQFLQSFLFAIRHPVQFLARRQRQKAEAEFNEFDDWSAGDLVFGEHRYHNGRIQMILQTASNEYHFGQDLLGKAQFCAAENRFWRCRLQLESARNERSLLQQSIVLKRWQAER